MAKRFTDEELKETLDEYLSCLEKKSKSIRLCYLVHMLKVVLTLGVI